MIEITIEQALMLRNIIRELGKTDLEVEGFVLDAAEVTPEQADALYDDLRVKIASFRVTQK